MQQETLTVGLGQRAYDIVIGPDLIDRAGSILGPIAANRHIIIVSDKTVATLHLDRLTAGLKGTARAIDHFAVAAGEASKSNHRCRHSNRRRILAVVCRCDQWLEDCEGSVG